MLAFLGERAGPRKVRLFLCACCRRVWDLLNDPRSRSAVEVAERFADGRADRRELAAARVAAIGAERRRGGVATAASYAASQRVAGVTENVSNIVIEARARQADDPDSPDRAEEWAASSVDEANGQGALIREIFGDPFNPPMIDRAWRAWNGGTVRRMAQVLYDSGRFEDMPILADALEEAGCDDPEILTHCREPQDHVRGCWLLDALLELG
jgi:hypothetical protein